MIKDCRAYTDGAEKRKRLTELGRCDACGVFQKQHAPDKCYVNYDVPCAKCGNVGHYRNTCDGPGKGHPGSWVLKAINENKA